MTPVEESERIINEAVVTAVYNNFLHAGVRQEIATQLAIDLLKRLGLGDVPEILFVVRRGDRAVVSDSVQAGDYRLYKLEVAAWRTAFINQVRVELRGDQTSRTLQ